PELGGLRLGERLGITLRHVDLARDAPTGEERGDLLGAPPRLLERLDVGLAIGPELAHRPEEHGVEHGPPAKGGVLDAILGDAYLIGGRTPARPRRDGY